MVLEKRKIHGDQPETNDEADDRRKNWYLDRSINIPTVIAIIFAFASIAGMWGTMQADKAKTQESIIELKAADSRTMDAFKELKADVKDTNIKVDMVYGNQREQMATLARIERKR